MDPWAFDITPRLDTVPSASELELSDDAVVSGWDIRNADATHSTADLAELTESRLSGCSLAHSNLRKFSACDVEFDSCDLALLRADESSWVRVRITESRLSGFHVTGATIQLVSVHHSNITDSLWRFAKLTKVRFSQCQLGKADFTGSTLSQVEFIDCDLTQADFSQARLDRVRFRNCTFAALAGITSLRGATIILTDPMDGLALLAPMAAGLGIALEEETPS